MSSRLRESLRARAHLVGPTAVAAVLRVAHLTFLAARAPLFLHPVADSWFHYNEAQQILKLGLALPGAGAFYKGPLYSYLLAVCLSVFGERGGLVTARLLSVAAGCVAVWLAARLADRLGGRRAAWMAGLTAALYGTAVYYDATLLDVSIVMALLLGAAERLVAAGHDVPERRALVTAGALLGLVSISRANGLLSLVVAVGWVFVQAWRRRSSPPAADERARRLPALTAAALLVLPAAGVIAPVTFRNAVLERDPVLVSWNGGINLFMGNDPGFDQTSGNSHADNAWTRLMRAPDELGLARCADKQRFFTGQARLAALSHPGLTLRILAEKVGVLLTGFEISNNERIYDARTFSPVLAVLMPGGARGGLPFALVWPAIVVALVLAPAVRVPHLGLPLALAASWAITPVLFFSTDRYRLAAVMLLVPPAAAVLVSAWEQGLMHAGRRRMYAMGAGLAALIVAIATVPSNPMLPPSDLFYRATVADREGRTAEALELLSRAVAQEPRNPYNRLRIAERLWWAGRADEALEQYRAVLDDGQLATDWHLSAMIGSARALAKVGRYAEAERWYARVLAAGPDAPRTGARADFHLIGLPPIEACRARLELAEVLIQDQRPADARAQLAVVATDCAAAPSLAAQARNAAAKLSAARAPAPH